MYCNVTYRVYENVVDRETYREIESSLICECPSYVIADRVRAALDETICSTGPAGTFYIEYVVKVREYSYNSPF